MKKLCSSIPLLLITYFVLAQVPQSFNYQAIVRDASGNAIPNQSVGIQASLLQTSASGTTVYVERFLPTTNDYGLINLAIGTGDVQSGVFAAIDWHAGPYFLKIELDEAGGTTYVNIGASQLFSVPYSMVSTSVTNKQDLSEVLYQGTNANNFKIENISELGIGTLNPEAQLHLKSVADVDIFLEADTNNYTESDNPTIKMSQDGGLTVGGWGFDINNWMYLSCYSTAGHGFYISTDSVMRLAIKDNGSIDVKDNNITNLADPVNNQDATTKAYVDLLEARIIILEEKLVNSGIILKDIDGNVYSSVRIGSQVWMAENLKVNHYRNGEPIPNVTNNTEWSNLITGARCYYDNDSAIYADTYGALYNWYTVDDSRSLCPSGWHVPSDADWAILETYLGGSSVAGGKMKETGTAHWLSPNTGATNESGFTALPGGYRYGDGDFGSIGNYGGWWSATEGGTNYAWNRYVYYTGSDVGRDSYGKGYGFSVRCLRD